MFKAGLIAGILLLFLISCNKDETLVPLSSTQADFTYELTNDGYAPCEVSFTNKSIMAAGYHWDFGNGQTSTEENPVVTYDSAGIFGTSLTCTPINDVFYNKLVKTVGINIKSPEAPAVTVMYFADRAAAKVKFLLLDGNPPVIQEFQEGDLDRIYGLAVDTVNRKVYMTDYTGGSVYMANSDGTGLTKIISTDLSVDGPYAIVVVDDKIYWAMQDAIFSANLDGSNPGIHINFGGNIPKLPLDMKFEPSSQKFYFVNDRYDVANGGGLWSVSLDGSNPTQIIADLDGTALDLDVPNGKMYFAAYAVAGSSVAEDGIYMCNMDGTGIQKIGDFGAKATWGIAHNPETGKLYWGFRATNSGPDGRIIQAIMDGSNQSDFINAINPYAINIVRVKL